MKNNLTIIFLFIFLIFNSISPSKTLAQPNNEQLSGAVNKYWHYRDRLKYFWVPSASVQGDGLVAGIRNTIYQEDWPYGADEKDENFEFGEEAVYMGYFLGVLATEYHLLKCNGLNTDQTVTELYYLLNGYIHTMDECEVDCYGQSNNSFDGFFVRTGFPPDYLSGYNPNPITNLQRLNEGLTENNDFDYDTHLFKGLNPGQPGWADIITPVRNDGHGCEPMSQDQAIGLLTGLALVAKYIPTGIAVYDNGQLVSGFDINILAKLIAEKIVKKIAYGQQCIEDLFGNYQCVYWHIMKPDGEYLGDSKGGDAHAFSRGFVFAATKITGLDTNGFNIYYSPPGHWRDYPTFWHALLPSSGNDWMACSLAAIGDSWGEPGHHANPNATGEYIGMITSKYNWDPFYVLLWAALHNEYINTNVVQYEINANPTTFDLLENAPCEGPYYYGADHFDPNGWCTSYRWHCTTDEQTNGPNAAFAGNYNGLDYMLFLNLYLIVSDNPVVYGSRFLDGEEFPYVNAYSHIVGDASYPVYNVSASTLESDTRFNNHLVGTSVAHAAKGTYKAQSKIILKPGFRVEEGSYFHGYIDQQLCNVGNISSICHNTPIMDEVEIIPPPDNICQFSDVQLTANLSVPPFYCYENVSYNWSVNQPDGSPLFQINNQGSSISFGVNHLGEYEYSVQASDNFGTSNMITGSFVVMCPQCCEEGPGKSMEVYNQDSNTLASENEASVIIHPNPSQGLILIQFISRKPDNANIQVLNSLGNIVYEQNAINAQTQQIDLSFLADGLYYLIVRNRENIYPENLIIAK